jgi:hypothetical protein
MKQTDTWPWPPEGYKYATNTKEPDMKLSNLLEQKRISATDALVKIKELEPSDPPDPSVGHDTDHSHAASASTHTRTKGPNTTKDVVVGDSISFKHGGINQSGVVTKIEKHIDGKKRVFVVRAYLGKGVDPDDGEVVKIPEHKAWLD